LVLFFSEGRARARFACFLVRFSAHNHTARTHVLPLYSHAYNQPTTTTKHQPNSYHRVALTLLKAAYRRAEALVAARRTAIRLLAEELLRADDERVTGDRVVEILRDTPLDAHDIQVESDFLPVVKQVLGRVPGVMAAADGQLRLKRRKGKKGGGAAGGKKSEGQAEQPEEPAGVDGGSTASFAPASGGAGRSGRASFRAVAASSSAASSTSAAPAAAAAEGDDDNDEDELRLDDETLRMVTRAVLGRTDLRDLLGRATSYDAAERVRDALLDPRTLERVRAVRRYVEDATADYGQGASGDSPEGARRGSAPFPPEPLAEDVPQPVYGAVWAPLEGWVRRARSQGPVTTQALDLLFTERQRQLYASDHPLAVGEARALPGEEGWVDPAEEEGKEEASAAGAQR
jgi:hypothetical protein